MCSTDHFIIHRSAMPCSETSEKHFITNDGDYYTSQAQVSQPYEYGLSYWIIQIWNHDHSNVIRQRKRIPLPRPQRPDLRRLQFFLEQHSLETFKRGLDQRITFPEDTVKDIETLIQWLLFKTACIFGATQHLVRHPRPQGCCNLVDTTGKSYTRQSSTFTVNNECPVRV